LKLRVYTIPVSAGFASVESAFAGFIAEQPGAEWYFGGTLQAIRVPGCSVQLSRQCPSFHASVTLPPVANAAVA
jgi:hypothetical protein